MWTEELTSFSLGVLFCFIIIFSCNVVIVCCVCLFGKGSTICESVCTCAVDSNLYFIFVRVSYFFQSVFINFF